MAESIPYSKRKFDAKHKQEYDNQYARDNYDCIRAMFPKGYKDKLKEAAAADHISMSEWIRQAVDEKLNNG